MKKEEMMNASAFLGVKILTPMEENQVLGGLGLEDVEEHHESHHGPGGHHEAHHVVVP